jgi:hypothetical protein
MVTQRCSHLYYQGSSEKYSLQLSPDQLLKAEQATLRSAQWGASGTSTKEFASTHRAIDTGHLWSRTFVAQSEFISKCKDQAAVTCALTFNRSVLPA